MRGAFRLHSVKADLVGPAEEGIPLPQRPEPQERFTGNPCQAILGAIAITVKISIRSPSVI
jgi:hypothetical protein